MLCFLSLSLFSPEPQPMECGPHGRSSRLGFPTLFKPSLTHITVLLLGDSKSCQVDRINLPTNSPCNSFAEYKPALTLHCIQISKQEEELYKNCDGFL
ncbi:rCG58310 [Rattus norvegicus]|uniref:RCG58310 n=1 Tax=Rattus norvegicus TaxID=10116 RepID=A6J547_RAT|nr:rCG58310 [Rattus norvegicus]